MKITPLDIRRREFKRSVRGYADEDVDRFLDTVADEFERLFRENMELQDSVHALEEQVAGHSHIREALEKTLIAAQLQSEEIRSNAEKQSESMLRTAETKAKGIVGELYAQTQKVQQTLIQLKLLEEDFRFKFRGLLGGYLKLLDEGPGVLAGVELGAPATAPAVGGAPVPVLEVPVVEGPPHYALPERDDGPTLETEEVMAVLAAAEGPAVAGPAQAAPDPAPAAPDPAPARTPAKGLNDTTEEQTAEAGATTAEGEAGKEQKAGAAKDENDEHGVFFGRPMDDPDEPFPWSGARPARVRDFEW